MGLGAGDARADVPFSGGAGVEPFVPRGVLEDSTAGEVGVGATVDGVAVRR